MDLPDDAPAPRNCQIIKWPDFEGYGFNLHAEKNRTGQFIGKVDEDSPAELAGLRPGDRIVEVNGVNIANENHKQVVERIKAITNETELLVLDEEADNWYKQKKIVVKSSMSQVICTKTPIPRPGSNVEPEPEPEEQEEDYEHETDQVIRQMKSEADRVEDEEVIVANDESTITTEDEKLPPPSIDGDEEADEQKSVEPESSPLRNEDVVENDPCEKINHENGEKIPDENCNHEIVCENTVRENLKNDVNVSLGTDEDDGKTLKDKENIEPHPIIDDSLQKEPVKLREVTPTSDRKSFQDSPRSSLSSEHRSTPPTSPVTPEPTPLDKPVEIRPSNGHSNGTANGRPSSGLNLNMSAQEMRQMLAQRKKKDIRKDQMDIRKKYDLVQKM